MFHFIITLPDETIPLDLDILTSIAEGLARASDHVSRGTVEISLISNDDIRTLNNTHRGINRETDVLSFAYYPDYTDLRDADVAGEIILCTDVIARQAQEHGHRPEIEAYRLITHASCHLLGYDHETDEDHAAMEPIEASILAYLKNQHSLPIPL